MVNFSTAAINGSSDPIAGARPAYILTKASTTLALGLLADSVKLEQLQVLRFHPGVVWGLGWAELGITGDAASFGNGENSSRGPG